LIFVVYGNGKANYESKKQTKNSQLRNPVNRRGKAKKGTTMNRLTQFKKIVILPSVMALALVALASSPVARADAVTDWNLIASNAIVVTAGQPPPVSVLHFAMVHGAVYDAVNAIDRGHRPYLVQPDANPTDSKEAAAATAAFRVLVGFPDLPGLFPAQQPTLQPIYDNYIHRGPA
jgi:hypothetical protein